MRSPTILLLSGWQTINIGDIGHTPGTLRLLSQHIPHARLITSLATTTPGASAMLKRRFPGVEFIQGHLDAQGRASTPEMQAAFDGCDLLIQNSGMIYNRFWHSSPALIQACHHRGKALCLYAQSFDGFAPEAEEQWAEHLSLVDLLYTRDTGSLKYLQRIGARPSVLEWGADGCFGIDVRDDDRAQAYLHEAGLQDGGFLAVIIRTNTPKLSGAGDTLNPARPTPEQAAQDEQRAQKLRECITAWVRETGRKVLLAPEVDKEIGPAKSLLLDRLPADVRAQTVHRDRFWNVDEAASIYARAGALLAMEPHSCIMALASGVPAVHFFAPQHGVKAAMFSDIGLPEWLLDIDALPARVATDALLSIESNPERARQKVQRAMSFVHARSAEMCGDIRRVLSKTL